MRELLKFWHIITSPDKDRALYVHRMYGKFYVKYPDGQRSQFFGYWVAKDYAEMFGGEVIYDPKGDQV